MTELPQKPFFLTSDVDKIAELHRFCRDAMATTFEVIISHKDSTYARQAALAALAELEKLENELSRFVENSDISRVNNLSAGQSVVVGLDAFECLKLSAKIHNETNGAFDVNIGFLLACFLDGDKKTRTASEQELRLARQRVGMTLLELNEDEHSVRVLKSPVRIDLGAIGKGYALDRMAALLREWSITAFLINGGYSTVLAGAAPPGTKGWPITFSAPTKDKEVLARLHLTDRAASGSGIGKGSHIIDPRTALPVKGKLAAWACAGNAAAADALSTAFMVMPPDEVKHYCSSHSGVQAVILLDAPHAKERIFRYGLHSEGLSGSFSAESSPDGP